MVTGTTVPVVCYRSFWFGTGTSDVRYRNIAFRERYVTETSPKLGAAASLHGAQADPENFGFKQDTTGLFVHKISRRCNMWCGRSRRLKFFALIGDPARVPVTIRFPEP